MDIIVAHYSGQQATLLINAKEINVVNYKICLIEFALFCK